MADRISIIVPAYNRKEMLLRLLQSFERLKCSCPLEFIIIDDASDDGTGEMVEGWKKTFPSAGVKYHRLPSRSGPARARNAAISLSTGNILAFTDSDCMVDPLWAENLYQRLIGSDFTGIGGRVLPLNDDIYSTYNTLFRILEPQPHLRSLVGANCIFFKQPVVDAGMFDEYFPLPGGEETALCMKLWTRGHRFGFEPGAVVYHEYRKTLKDFIRVFLQYGIGERIMMENRLVDYLRYMDYPERIDTSPGPVNNFRFALVFFFRILLNTFRQIPLLSREPLSPVQRVQLFGLSLIQNVCYHAGRGTFSGTLQKTVNRFLLDNPGSLLRLDSKEIPSPPFLEITGETLPEIIRPGQRVYATITIKNLSNDRWISAEYAVIMRSVESAKPLFRSEKPRNLLLPPGSVSASRFRVYPPDEKKDHHVSLFIASPSGIPLSNIIRKTITVTADRHHLDAEIITTEFPAEMIQKETVPVCIVMKNTGRSAWSEKENIRLGSVDDELGTGALFGDLRFFLPEEEPVRPGARAKFAFRITAPANPGRYAVRYRMLWEDNAWFGKVVEQNIDVKPDPSPKNITPP